jgi:hypothetical protein
MDGIRRLEHAFVDCPVLNYAPLLVHSLDGEGCQIQALFKIVHRERQMDPRSTRATKVSCPRVPKTKKSAVQC